MSFKRRFKRRLGGRTRAVDQLFDSGDLGDLDGPHGLASSKPQQETSEWVGQVDSAMGSKDLQWCATRRDENQEQREQEQCSNDGGESATPAHKASSTKGKRGGRHYRSRFGRLLRFVGMRRQPSESTQQKRHRLTLISARKAAARLQAETKSKKPNA
jgi:hypothetical protein